MDTLIANVTAVTMNPKMEVIFGAYIGIEGGKIVSIGKQAPKEPPKTVIDIYVTRSGKRVAAFDGRLWALVEVEKRHQVSKAKQAGRPKFIPGPNHPWKRYVLKAKKG